jgi:hypothetical protein
MTRGGRTDRVAGDSPFLPEALEANRGGTLTEAQRRTCQAQSRRVRWFGAGIGGLVIVLGLLFAVTRHSSSVMPLRPVVLIGCLLIGAIVLWRALTGGDRFTADIRRGEVGSVDGALHKRAVRLTASQGASPKPRYYFDVAGQTLEVMWESAYESAPQARYVRVFSVGSAASDAGTVPGAAGQGPAGSAARSARPAPPRRRHCRQLGQRAVDHDLQG